MTVEAGANMHGLRLWAAAEPYCRMVKGSATLDNFYFAYDMSWLYAGMKAYVNYTTYKVPADITSGSKIVAVSTSRLMTGMSLNLRMHYRYTGSTVKDSKIVTLATSFRAITGMHISGDGIPSGTYVESFDIPAKKITMTQEATATVVNTNIYLDADTPTGILSGTTIDTIDGGSQLTMSQAATETGGAQIYFSATPYLGIPENTLIQSIDYTNKIIYLDTSATEDGTPYVTFEPQRMWAVIEMIERPYPLQKKIITNELVYAIPTVDGGEFAFRVKPMTTLGEYGWSAELQPPFWKYIFGVGGGQIDDFRPGYAEPSWLSDVYTSVVNDGGGLWHVDFYWSNQRLPSQKVGYTAQYPASATGYKEIFGQMGGHVTVNDTGPIATNDLLLRAYKEDAAVRSPKLFSGSIGIADWFLMGKNASCYYNFPSIWCYGSESKDSMITHCNWGTHILPNLVAAPVKIQEVVQSPLLLDNTWWPKIAAVNDYCYKGYYGYQCDRYVSEDGRLAQIGGSCGPGNVWGYNYKLHLTVTPAGNNGIWAIVGDMFINNFNIKVMWGYNDTGYHTGTVLATFPVTTGYSGIIDIPEGEISRDSVGRVNQNLGITFVVDDFTPITNDPRYMGMPYTNCWMGEYGSWCGDFLNCWGGMQWAWESSIDAGFTYDYVEN